MSQLLKTAFAELGVAEIAGSEHEKRIVEYAKKAGFEAIQDDETPWCSIFVNFCCSQSELESSGKANARSWMQVGKPVTDPMPGDVVVFWRESEDSWKGHVGFFLGYSEDHHNVFCLGGNQGNKVSVASYDTAKILGFRRVQSLDSLVLAEPVLKAGDRGEEVIKLQTSLNELGYPCGDADGIFGDKCTRALRKLQANNRLTVDGIYGNQSRVQMESLFQT